MLLNRYGMTLLIALLSLMGCGTEAADPMMGGNVTPAGFGQPCTSNAGCQSNLCHPTSMRCTAMCTDSFQCGVDATCEGGLCTFGTNSGGAGGNAGSPGTGGIGGNAGGGAGGNAGAGGGTVATASDVYTVKGGQLADDTTVTVEGVVTATRINAEGLYSHMVIQVPADHSSYRGEDNSGLWVYLNNTDDETLRSSPPAPGSLVRVTGRTNNFYDQQQIQHVERVEVLGQAQLPAPVSVSSADVATGGPRAMALEGMLVTVQNVEVIEVEPVAGPGDGMDGMPTYEFVVTGNLRIDDYFYRMEPLPAVGTRFGAITGVLRWGNANSKIEPRSASDYQ